MLSPYIQRCQVNKRIFLIGQVFWFIETWHYGWNFAPQSDGEVVCDGIVLLITAISLVGYKANPSAEPK
jgi:hypothetical protein